LFWFHLGYPREGLALLEHVLAGSTAAPAALRAKALLAAFTLAYTQEDFRKYGQLLEAYQPLVQALGDQPGMALERVMHLSTTGSTDGA
jgi:hypothetical protein